MTRCAILDDYQNVALVIDRVFGFDRVLEAIRYYETGAKIGKVVTKVT